MTFTIVDYVVLVVYLSATAIFGLLIGRGQKNTNDYFLGGKRMPWWVISFSIVATETSTLTFIGAPAIAFTGDLTFLQLAFGYLLGKLLVSTVLIPGYFRGEIQTAYELLNNRFGAQVRDFAASIFQLTRMIADGVRLFATALVLAVVTGITDVWTILIIGAVTILYTFFGGMTAVVWNDFIQLVIYIGGAMLAFWFVLDRIPGGWAEVVSIANAEEKLEFLKLDWNLHEPYTILAGLIGGAFLTFATHGTDQMMVQRYLACGDQRKSRIALITSGVIVFFQFLLFLFIGVMLFAYYKHFPLETELGHVNELLPTFVVREMPQGLSGLIIAAIFAAAMSTLSSSLNSLSSSSLNDFYRARFVTGASESHYLRVSRYFTLTWGILLILVAIVARTQTEEVLQAALTITSIPMGSMLGIFLLGTFSKEASQKTGLLSMIAGLIVMLLVSQFSPLAWTWYVLVGTVTTLTCGITLKRLDIR